MEPLLRFSATVSAVAAVLAKPVLAHCPLCAAATAGGVAATRLLGVDDSVSGTFVGGFVASTALWLDIWLKKKRNGRELLPFQSTILVIASLAFTILTFYMAKLLSSLDPVYHMFGVDKLLVGTVVGTAVTVGSFALHKWIRKVRGGKSLMPFQGIALTLASLVITGAIFFFITQA